MLLSMYVRGTFKNYAEKMQQKFYPYSNVYRLVPLEGLIIVKFLCMQILILMQPCLNYGC